MYLLFSVKATQQDGATTQPPSWKHFPEISSEPVSIKKDCGLWTGTTECGLCINRSRYKKARGPGIKHWLRQRAMI